MLKNIKSYLIMAILLILFVISSVLFFIGLRINNNYNNYLSKEMYTDVFDYSTSVLKTDKILDIALQSGKITNSDVNILGSEFFNQSNNFGNMFDIEKIQNVSIYHNNMTSIVSDAFAIYLSTKMLNRPTNSFDQYSQNANQIIILNDKQQSKFKTMKEIDDNWADIIKKNVKGISTNGDYTVFYGYSNAKYTYWDGIINDIINYGTKMNWNKDTLITIVNN
jgi:hypothetical protein